MTDKILAIISMGMLITFMGIVVWYIREPDLTIITVVVLGMGSYDFWRTIRTNEKKKAEEWTQEQQENHHRI
ncbi:MAG: hypothetical protein OQJ99_01965 [Rhodospirillales bacterium]|nr:hypothetical protein [Rhodospirillales bacterium]MCW8862144.1 hypothetical protein [Rhodospirillales bacterium]MCW8953100.1 hypothetical protein [Rhodospirillales bacterium]MCW8971027.1 hypothetical protein [Rhodospirillales bacterium]MCW9040212.1 hypothetical protein [Rhodospirillales bacterium]